MAHNWISDIKALSGMLELQTLDLGSNLIVDIESLVENDGIGNGDEIILSNNLLNEVSINRYLPLLKERGVELDIVTQIEYGIE